MVSRSRHSDGELRKLKSALLEAVKGTDRGIFGIPVSVQTQRLHWHGQSLQRV